MQQSEDGVFGSCVAIRNRGICGPLHQRIDGDVAIDEFHPAAHCFSIRIIKIQPSFQRSRGQFVQKFLIHIHVRQVRIDQTDESGKLPRSKTMPLR